MHSGDGRQKQLFGEEAFNAFNSAILDENYEPLRDIFGEQVGMRIRRYLDPDMPPSEAEMDRVRALLNAMGGDF